MMRSLIPALALAGAAAAQPVATPLPVPPPPAATAAGMPPPAAMAGAMATAGYLPGAAIDVTKVLPSPPKAGSAAERADRRAYARAGRAIGGPQWQRAITELDPTGPAYHAALACAAGRRLDPATTPATMVLLARSGRDFALPMAAGKSHWARPRPFSTGGGQACDPSVAAGQGDRLGFAYPSGHAGLGWLWARILTDALPARARALKAFGRESGDLRVACRVHWPSDVEAGRRLGEAVYRDLVANAAFQADLARARAELAAAPPADCPAR